MDAHNDRSRFERYLDMVVQRRVEGLIVVANWLFVKIDALRQLAQNRLPTVVVGRDLHRSGVRSVLVDNERGGYMALRHLYELGHRKVNFLLGPKQLSDSSRRWAGMQRFAAQAGIEIARVPRAAIAGAVRSADRVQLGRGVDREVAAQWAQVYGHRSIRRHDGVRRYPGAQQSRAESSG